MKNTLTYFIFFIVILLTSFPGKILSQDLIDTRGNDFWLAFLPNFHNYENDPISNYTDSLYIFIVATDTCSGLIEYKDINGKSYSKNFIITDPKNIYSFSLPYLNFELRGFNRSGTIQTNNNYQCEKIAPQAFHITSTADITIYAHEQAVTTSESMTCLPTDALGTDYIVLTYNSDGNEGFGSIDGQSTPSQFLVVATEDSTQVIIVPKVATRVNGTKTQTINLNKGDVYLVQAQITNTNLNGDLTGSRVTSNKPISLIAGHQRTRLPINGNVTSRDCLLEQLPPLSAWGRNAIVIPFAQSKQIFSSGNDIFRILSGSDNNDITIDGIPILTLSQGSIFEMELTEPHYIEGTGPILVAQYKKSSQSGVSGQNGISDPLMMIMPPIEQYGNFYRIANIQSYEPGSNNKFDPVYSEHYVGIIIPDSVTKLIKIDGNFIGANFFKKVPNSNFSYCFLQVTQGTHELIAPTGFGLTVYGYGYANSYGYYGGMNLVKYDFTPPKILASSNCYTITGIVTDSSATDTRVTELDFPATNLINVDIQQNNSFPTGLAYFTASLHNHYLDGSFQIKAMDSAGLSTSLNYDIPGFTINYQGFRENTTPFQVIDTVPSGTEVCFDIPIENYGKFQHTLYQIYLKSTNQTDTLLSLIPITLNSGDVQTIKVCKTFADTGTYNFELIIEDSCEARTITNFQILSFKDNKPPTIQVKKDPCNQTFDVEINETLKSDSGIELFKIEAEENGKIDIQDQNTKYIRFHFTVNDPREDAYYKFIVVDSMGNSKEYEEFIPGFTLSFITSSINPQDSNKLDFGSRMIGARHQDTILLTNYGKYTIVLDKAYMFNNTIFSIPQSQFPFTIEPQQTKPLVVIYKPVDAKIDKDLDTVRFNFNCLDKFIYLEGAATVFDVTQNSKCNVPLKFTTDSIPTSLEASLKSSIIEGIVEINFKSDENTNLVISLYDQFGILRDELFNGTLPKGTAIKVFNLNNLVSSVYFIKVSTNFGTGVFKIIKL